MGLSQARDHADRVLQVVRGGLLDRGDDVVTQSWLRCVNDYRLDPGHRHEPSFVSRVDMEERRARFADVVACARHEMTTLFQQLADNDSATVLTDTDGVVMHIVASPDFGADAAKLGLRIGGRWGETDAGTNGMGTCLVAARPVSVRRDDHFYTQLTQLTCSAVPIHDPLGRITAVLDVTSRSPQMQQHVLVLLGMTARMIENRLIDLRFRNAHPLHFHSRPEFVYTLHEGRLAVDDDGRVLAANRSALFQLGLQSVDEVRTRRVEDLFQTSLEEMLHRSSNASYHPVVTYRANAALRFFAVARRPAAQADHGVVQPPRVTPVRPAEPRAAGPVFDDPRLAAHLDTARRVIARNTPILLCAETGAGKELFARAVHVASPNAAGAFVAVNCASLPATLIEAELFGYRAGAFTGAQRTGRRGKILQADGGTLFLDEIADMPLELQARLLRVLDDHEVTPLGTEEVHPVDFQLISASHQSLPDLVRDGRFRADLYYRLAGIELALPALRERGDRRALIIAMLEGEGGHAAALSAEAERLLLDHPWPGNIRQLRHVLRSAVALADGGAIRREHLVSLNAALAPAPAAAPAEATAAPETDEPAFRLNPIQASERVVLLQMLEQHRWNVSNVAKALDVSRNTLYRKLHKLHIEVSHPH